MTAMKSIKLTLSPLYCTPALLLGTNIYAHNPKDDYVLIPSIPPIITPTPFENTTHQHTANIHTIDEKELWKNPKLFTEILNQAIERGSINDLRLLTPLYGQLHERDEILHLFAKAIIAEYDNHITLALTYYQQILVYDPTLTPIQVRLYQAYRANKQHKSADNVLRVILADDTLPPSIRNELTRQHSPNKKRPNITFNARYLNDRNVNNAPRNPNYYHWQVESAQKAHGVGYQIEINHNNTPMDYWQFSPNLSITGKYYWDKSQYNDTIAEFTTPITYQKAKFGLTFAPYHQKRYFGNHAYSNTTGLKIQGSYLTAPNWQSSAYLTYGKKKHHKRDFLDGDTTTLSVSLTHYKPHHHWYTGIQLVQDNAKDQSESYHQQLFYAGIEKRWHLNTTSHLNTSHSFGVGQKQHHAPDIFNIKRHDKLYFTQHSLWYSKLQYKGFVPSVHWRYERKDSNHFAFDTKNHQAFIEINKKF